MSATGRFPPATYTNTDTDIWYTDAKQWAVVCDERDTLRFVRFLDLGTFPFDHGHTLFTLDLTTSLFTLIPLCTFGA